MGLKGFMYKRDNDDKKDYPIEQVDDQKWNYHTNIVRFIKGSTAVYKNIQTFCNKLENDTTYK